MSRSRPPRPRSSPGAMPRPGRPGWWSSVSSERRAALRTCDAGGPAGKGQGVSLSISRRLARLERALGAEDEPWHGIEDQDAAGRVIRTWVTHSSEGWGWRAVPADEPLPE